MRSLIFALFLIGIIGINAAVQEYEDNDFAEFEVFDEEEEIVGEEDEAQSKEEAPAARKGVAKEWI